jgi:hypothetical protein
MNFVLQPWQLLLAIRAVGVPRSADCPIATSAWRRQARVHGKAWRHAGHRERLRLARKNASHTPIFHPRWKAISDSASASETPRALTNAFAAECGRPTTFSVGTTMFSVRTRLAHTYATFLSANCQRRKVGAPFKRYLNTIVTRSIGLALNGPFCVDPAGRRGFRDPQPGR